MGNCSCACLQASSAAAASASESKRRLLRKIIVVHSMEGRVMEVGAGAPMTVAELMLEFPGHFVSECEMDISATDEEIASICSMMKRASPLSADHEAAPGHIYILFPMHRLHTRVPPQESAFLNTSIGSHLAAATNSPSKKKQQKQKPQKLHHHHLHGLQASSKVTPLNMHSNSPHQHEEDLPHSAHDEKICLSDEEIDSFLQQFCSSQQQKGSGISFNTSSSLMRSKSWIPKLETISESSILSLEGTSLPM